MNNANIQRKFDTIKFLFDYLKNLFKFLDKILIMSNINNRLNLIKEHYGINSYAEFAKHTGLSHQSSSNYLKGKQKPDIEKLAVIIQSFDEINAHWLLTGKGNMFIETDLNNVSLEEIIKHLYKYPKEELNNDETWNMFLELQFKNKHIEEVKNEINKLKKLKNQNIKKS